MLTKQRKFFDPYPTTLAPTFYTIYTGVNYFTQQTTNSCKEQEWKKGVKNSNHHNVETCSHLGPAKLFDPLDNSAKIIMTPFQSQGYLSSSVEGLQAICLKTINDSVESRVQIKWHANERQRITPVNMPPAERNLLEAISTQWSLLRGLFESQPVL